MGSGGWFKNIISLKKSKNDGLKKLKGSAAPEKSDGFKQEHHFQKESNYFRSGASKGNAGVPGMPVEDIAATRIQTAFRAYMARKTLHHLKRIVRLQSLIQGHSVRKQGSTILSYLHSQSNIQAQIRARRICMVTEDRIKRKKLENQLKLEIELHGLEVEWNDSSETMEEIVGRVHLREAASVKRERAMAYAFSHQWRANSNPNIGLNNHELGKTNWGWSWMERWIAARPWESRVPVQSSSKKAHSRQASKTSKSINTPKMKTSNSIKSTSPPTKTRKLSYTTAEKPVSLQSNTRAEETNIKKEHPVS